MLVAWISAFQNYIFCLGLDIRVAQVVESDPAQTVLFQQLWKACRHGIRLDQVSHRIYEYISKVLLIIAVAADFLAVYKQKTS